MVQAEVVEPFLRSLRGMGTGMGTDAWPTQHAAEAGPSASSHADSQMFAQIAGRMGHLYEFFKKLNDQDRHQIR